MSDFNQTRVTIDLPPSQSGLLVDSRGRAANESPYDFMATFTSAIKGSQITYSKFDWCQPLYSHTGVSCAFMFDLFKPDNYSENPLIGSWYPAVDYSNDTLNVHYVVYHKPYCAYEKFDGNDADGIPYQTPTVGSYASDVETALNTDVRITENNLIPVDLSDEFPDIAFQFRYSASAGFRLTASYTDSETETTVPLGIRIFDCNSVRGAHRVHGFGVECNWNPLDINRGIITTSSQYVERIGSTTNEKVWLPAWLANIANNPSSNFQPVNLNTTLGLAYVNFSDATPTLIPIEYIQIFSPELTFQRKLPSFRNVAAQSTSGNDEMGTFPTTLENIGRYRLLAADEDANVWSLRADYTPQKARFIVTDEDGNTLTVSNIMTNYFRNMGNGQNISIFDYQEPLIAADQNFRSPAAINYLIFGIPSITQEGKVLSPTQEWGSPSAVSLDCDVAHYLLVINA